MIVSALGGKTLLLPGPLTIHVDLLTDLRTRGPTTRLPQTCLTRTSKAFFGAGAASLFSTGPAALGIIRRFFRFRNLGVLSRYLPSFFAYLPIVFPYLTAEIWYLPERPCGA